jgi:Aspartyl protease
VKFPFKELPGTTGDYLRPAVPVTVEGIPRAPQLCLLDTGALHNRFGAWVAEAAGIELSDAEEQGLAVGGFQTGARQALVRLTLGDVTWEAPVWFCDPWPLAFHLLGQEGFFRWFDIRVRAARYEIDITPETE